jgi:hypothetical protein
MGMTVSGKVSDIERRDEDGEARVSFWLEQSNRTKIHVEVPHNEQVTLGEDLEVDGKMNSEGSFVAETLRRPTKAVVDPNKKTGPEPPPKRPWKIIVGVAAAIIAVVITWKVIPSHPTGVPDVTGDSESEARTKLEKAGLRVGNTRLETVEDNNVGKIVGQTPVGGTPIPTDSARPLINLVIGGVGAPKLIDLTIDNATLELGRKGLVVGNVTAVSKAGGNLAVIEQNPTVGMPLRRGQAVNMSFSIPLLVLRPAPNILQDVRRLPNFSKVDQGTQRKYERAISR